LPEPLQRGEEAGGRREDQPMNCKRYVMGEKQKKREVSAERGAREIHRESERESERESARARERERERARELRKRAERESSKNLQSTQALPPFPFHLQMLWSSGCALLSLGRRFLNERERERARAREREGVS
jgi:hypothetical protein